jgi:hypothetical protein
MFLLHFSVFQYSIRVADLGWSVNHIKPFDIIVSTKLVFFISLWGGGGCSPATPFGGDNNSLGAHRVYTP